MSASWLLLIYFQFVLQALEADQDLERAEVLARTLLLALFVSSGTPVVSASTLSRKVRLLCCCCCCCVQLA
jgi:hypothetical protein